MLSSHSPALLRRGRKDNRDSASKPERSPHEPLSSLAFTGLLTLPSGGLRAHLRTMYIYSGCLQHVLCLLFIFDTLALPFDSEQVEET